MVAGVVCHLKAANLSIQVISIRVKVVKLGSKEINGLYGLLDAEPREFKEKYYAPRSWLVSYLCLGKEVP